MAKIDTIIPGTVFGRLTFVRVLRGSKRAMALCVCDCGAEKIRDPEDLLSRKNAGKEGCGMHGAASTIHGLSHDKTFRVWLGLRDRCLNKNNKAYRNYGARGITVCDRWLKFENFLADMGTKPDDKTLDRINNDDGYSPSNCRWTTDLVQGGNRRGVYRVEFNGRTQPIGAWAADLGIQYATLKGRFRRGERPPYLFRPLSHSGPQPKKYTANGKTLTVAEWADELGINATTIYVRMQKWPIEKVLTPSMFEFRKGRPRPKATSS